MNSACEPLPNDVAALRAMLVAAWARLEAEARAQAAAGAGVRKEESSLRRQEGTARPTHQV
jgi:hypothetical protein